MAETALNRNPTRDPVISYSLLADPHIIPLSKVPVGDGLPETAALPRVRQPCVNASEPLNILSDLALLDAYSILGVLPARPTRLRSGVITRLMAAEALLPSGFTIVVLDGWRCLQEQQRVLKYYGSQASELGFVAPVDPAGARPPHTTGGAVDLTLCWQGMALGLGTDYDAFVEAARLEMFEDGSDELLRRLRRLLANVLDACGMICYKSEWWHWSYGDDVWAAANGRDAIYEIWEFEAESRCEERFR